MMVVVGIIVVAVVGAVLLAVIACAGLLGYAIGFSAGAKRFLATPYQRVDSLQRRLHESAARTMAMEQVVIDRWRDSKRLN